VSVALRVHNERKIAQIYSYYYRPAIPSKAFSEGARLAGVRRVGGM